MKVDYFSGKYLPDDNALWEFMKNISMRTGDTAITALTLDGTLFDVAENQEIGEAVLDDDGPWGAGFSILMSAGSVLSSPSDFLLDATTVASKLGVKYAAAIGLTSAWYAINYPIIGGALAFFGWWGPPGWLLAASAYLGVTTTDWAIGGVRSRFKRKRACDAVRIAYPLCVWVIESDGKVTASEAGFLRDLIRKSPIERKDWQESTSLSREEAIFKLTSTRKGLRRAVLERVILSAFADALYDPSEVEVVRDISEAIGESDKWVKKQVTKVARQIRLSEVLAESVFRSCVYISYRDGELDDEESEMLNAILLAQIRDENKRRELAENALRKRREISLLNHDNIRGLCRMTTKSFPRLSDKDWPSRSYIKKMGKQIIEQAAMFVIAVGENAYQKGGLLELGRILGYEVKKTENIFEKTKKRLEKVEKKLSTVSTGKCPYCGKVGKFNLSKQCLIERDAYRCNECGQEVMLCIWPKCKNMTKTGDFWDDRFCPEHTDKMLFRV